jgi:aspartyl-tRNA(Asn)/glutamyl-tRNA(Gln) amidotransferase subunit A
MALISDISDRVAAGEASAEELVASALKEIDRHKGYNAILDVSPHAGQKARELDKAVKAGRRGRLLGVPFVAKDNFLTFDTETTAASNILKGFRAPYQATAIERLEAEGAIMIAKGNLDAFAHGSSTEHSDFGPTKNPHDTERVPGGSSGGPAAAVALDIAPFALGTDTGGSIRLPASFCGVVGYKPTYGLISRYGVIAMGSSTDVIGPLTRSVDDAALVLDVMSGRDERDGTTIERDPDDYRLGTVPKKLRVGVIKEYLGAGLDPGVRSAVEYALEKLRGDGAEVHEISLPSLDLSLACYYVIVPAEISSNLARYDGIKFGYSHGSAGSLDEIYDLSRSHGFGAEAKRRIMIGTYVLSSGYYDAYYKKAMQVRTLIIRDYARAFEKIDLLAGPVAPTAAFRLGEHTDDPLRMYLADIMTVGPSLAGLPAVSVPVGKADGLPVGLQLIGAQRSDRLVLAAARRVEQLLAGSS